MTSPRSLRAGAGLTLVELLVAMTLVATMTAGGLVAYARANATWRAQAADQRRLERAQYVFGTLEPDLQMAGYFAAARPDSPLPEAAIPPSVRHCGAALIARIDRAVERLATLPARCVASAMLLAGSDVLVVRRVSAHASAARAGRAQWITTLDPQPRGELAWNGQLPPGMQDPELRELVVRIYYVARSADGDAGTPALRVKTLTEIAGAPAFVDTEVMPGVESLRMELLPPDTPQSVRLTLRVRADAADVDLPDARRALSLTRQFTLRNAPPDAG
jgi:hypothetical protein